MGSVDPDVWDALQFQRAGRDDVQQQMVSRLHYTWKVFKSTANH